LADKNAARQAVTALHDGASIIVLIELPAPLQPLRRRLPILISALLLAVVGAFSWAAYHRFERALLAAGQDRVSNASQRLAAALGESSRRGRAEWARIVADSTIRRYLRTGDQNAAVAARRTMRRWLDSIPAITALEFRDRAGVAKLTLPSAERRASVSACSICARTCCGISPLGGLDRSSGDCRALSRQRRCSRRGSG
jgi:hypothetical protein